MSEYIFIFYTFLTCKLSHSKLYMATFMNWGEQEQCHSVPGALRRGGLRISQWHKLCGGSRAGVTLAGTTGQLSLSRIFPGFLYFEIRSHAWSSPKVSCFLFLSNFIPQYCSTASMVLSAFICSHSVYKRLQVDTYKLAAMPECSPPSSWRRRLQWEYLGKAVRR